MAAPNAVSVSLAFQVRMGLGRWGWAPGGDGGAAGEGSIAPGGGPIGHSIQVGIRDAVQEEEFRGGRRGRGLSMRHLNHPPLPPPPPCSRHALLPHHATSSPLQDTSLAGLPSMLTAVLLHAAPSCIPAEASPAKLPVNFVHAAALVMRVLNNVAR